MCWIAADFLEFFPLDRMNCLIQAALCLELIIAPYVMKEVSPVHVASLSACDRGCKCPRQTSGLSSDDL